MDKSLFWVVSGLCGLLPVLLIVAGVAFSSSSRSWALSKAKVVKAARKRVNWDPDISRDQPEHLRDLFYPAWARRGPRDDSEVVRSGALYGVFGLGGAFGGVLAEMFGQMRWSFLSMAIDNRIDAAIDQLIDAEEGGSRRRRRRGRGY